jgi:hypothetical protein
MRPVAKKDNGYKLIRMMRHRKYIEQGKERAEATLGGHFIRWELSKDRCFAGWPFLWLWPLPASPTIGGFYHFFEDLVVKN